MQYIFFHKVDDSGPLHKRDPQFVDPRERPPLVCDHQVLQEHEGRAEGIWSARKRLPFPLFHMGRYINAELPPVLIL